MSVILERSWNVASSTGSCEPYSTVSVQVPEWSEVVTIGRWHAGHLARAEAWVDCPHCVIAHDHDGRSLTLEVPF